MVFLHRLPGPEAAPGGEVEGIQDPGAAHREDATLRDRRRGPRADARYECLIADCVGVAPARAAGLKVVGHHALLAAALLLRYREVAEYGKAGPALPDRLSPETAGSACRPVTGKPQPAQGAVSARTEELREVARATGRFRGHRGDRGARLGCDLVRFQWRR